MPQGQAIQQHPRSDTSTGSLETPDAPRSLCTRNQSSVQPTKLVLRIDGFMHTQSFSMQPPTNFHGSVPFSEFALYTL
jgi:hypothetical protein